MSPCLVELLALLAPTTLVAPLLGAALVSGMTLLLTLLWLREPLRREDGKVARAPAGALNLNVDGRRAMSPLQGFGQMWQKTLAQD
jgi:hypothetical protein